MNAKSWMLLFSVAAAGVSASAKEPDGTYVDAGGVTQNIQFTTDAYSPDFYWRISENVSDVVINAYEHETKYGSPDGEVSYGYAEVDIEVSRATLDGLTLTTTGSSWDLHGYSFIANVDSTVCGNISFSSSSIGSYAFIFGDIGAGTRFLLDGSGNFLYLHGERWDISEEDAASETALISGDGRLGMNSSKTLTLNFLTEVALKKADSVNLIADTIQTQSSGYANFAGIEIAVDGVVRDDYAATLILDRDSADFGKVLIAQIPEPSAFGLLAGAGALALVAARRRTSSPAEPGGRRFPGTRFRCVPERFR